uniref:Putative Peptidase M16 n=1 Tax=Magnetococcus massalia (strain MO-1) TaxID=451514 RepID=A0A1S7LDI8_MAGMO|nr:putative Peptidase M16 [Candidatus Magnetococcus massalia]
MMNQTTAHRLLGALLLLFLWVPTAQSAFPVERFTLANGLTVLLVESHSNPMVEFRLLTRAGSAYDPNGLQGIAYVMGWMANEGAGELEAQAFQEKLDFRGMRLYGSTSRDYLKYQLTTLSRDLDEAFQMLVDAVKQPRFDAEPLARVKRERIASYEQSREDADTLADEALMQALFSNHPYRHPVGGYPRTIEKITPEDLHRFHQKAIRAPNMVLSVAGDISLKKLKSLVQQHFSGLSPDPGPFGAPVTRTLPLQQAGFTQQHIHKQGPQTVVQMGWMGIDRHDPDYFAVYMLNHLLGGGGFTSRLTQEIREKRGLTYSVHSYFVPWEGRGGWEVGMRTRNQSRDQALALARAELAKIRHEGISEEELSQAKKHLLGAFPIMLDSLSKLASTWSIIGFYKRGWDYLERWPERVAAVTTADLKRVANRFFNENQMVAVMVGPEGVEQKISKANERDSSPKAGKYKH